MANFREFWPTLLRFEGGYVDDARDPGGATNMGITYHVFCRFSERILDLKPTIEDFRLLTIEQAARIYKTEYWDALHCDHIAYQSLANILFDFYVNAGHHAISLLSQVMEMRGVHVRDRVTLDRATLELLRQSDAAYVYLEYKFGRAAYYRRLASEHPVLRRYLKGWLRRVDSFPDTV